MSWGCAGGARSRPPGSGHQGATGGGDGWSTKVNSPKRESVRSIIWATPCTPPCGCCPSRLETDGVEDFCGGALGSELYGSREGLSGWPARRVDHRGSYTIGINVWGRSCPLERPLSKNPALFGLHQRTGHGGCRFSALREHLRWSLYRVMGAWGCGSPVRRLDFRWE